MGITTTAPSARRGILLGIGLGGFVDGIVLHQIGQWHNMLSSTARWPRTTLEGMEANMLADGLFHAAAWMFVALGVYVLWSRMRAGGHASGQALLGWALAGWGLFNLVEGIVNHQILAWDLGFLAFGAVLLAGGWLLARSGERTPGTP
jgi:uncharacterized membrane protein